MLDRTAFPTEAQREAVGRKAAEALTLTVTDVSSNSRVTDEAGLYALITTQASRRTWGDILGATWDQIAGNGIPASVLDAGLSKGFSRETVGRLVQEAAEAVFQNPPSEGEPEPERIPDGTLVEWTGVDDYGTSLTAGALVRIVSGRETGSEPGHTYTITGTGDANGPDGSPQFTVRDRHIKRPTILTGYGRYAFTLTMPTYHASIEIGSKVEVISGPDGDGDYYCRSQDNGYTGYYKVDGLEPWTEARQRQVDEAAKVAEAVVETVMEQPEVVALQRQVESLRQQVTDLNRWRSQAQSDMSTASEILIDESNRRNWCSEYDQIIENINGRMNVLAFDDREQDTEMEAEIEAEVTLELRGYSFSGTMTVSIGYTGRQDEDPYEADYITDETVEEHVASELGVSYRSVSVDSWTVESYTTA